MFVFVLLLAGVVASVGFLWRNWCVREYRLRLINEIRDAGLVDIRHGQPWEWRWRVYETVSYDAMLFQFWRSLDSFYPAGAFDAAPEGEV